MKKLFGMFSLIGALSLTPALAQAQPVALLGQRSVQFAVDRDVIPVTARDGLFRRVQLEVLGNGVEIFDLHVTFGNGQTLDVPVREFIPAGGRTRIIDLPGDLRVIRNVQVIYRTRGVSRGRATVRLFGIRV